MAGVAIVATAALAEEVVPLIAEAALPVLEEAGAEVVPLAGDALAHLGQSVESVYFEAENGLVTVATQTTESVLNAGGRAFVHLTDAAGNVIHVATSEGGAFAGNAWAGIGGAVGGAVGTAAVAGVVHFFNKLF